MKMRTILMAAGLVALGSLATYWVMRRAEVRRPDLAVQDPASTAGPEAPLPDIAFTLSKNAIERAGIVIGRPGTSTPGGLIRVPAVFEPNAYRSVVVTPVVSGRVTSVSAELGQQVRRGQTLAEVYSPELADAQSRYLASRAELDAHERELRRTERLVEIGSASKQELERIHAEHTAAVTMVQSLRSRLSLLGMTPAQVETISSPSAAAITASVAIPAPLDGAITARAANIGLNVHPATELFKVVDLSTVWLVGDLYERDFARVRVGAPVTVTKTAYPDLVLEGQVSYIDTEIKAETRTARVRVELPNPGRRLRFGMYAEMEIRESPASGVQRPQSSPRVSIPRTAVQVTGNHSVVYLTDSRESGRFIEREVRLGASTGDDVEVVSGVQPGDSVVIKGSFALRAERERLGLRVPSQTSQTSGVRITVSEKGFEPARVTLRAGMTARLTFIRTTDATCATEVAIPSLNIKRTLPLNEPVAIELTPAKPGDIAFACGMEMFSGTIVVR